MDLNNLKEKVAALGFDVNVSSRAFISAVNRALQRVNTLFPKIGVTEFLHSPVPNVCEQSDHLIRFKGNFNISFTSLSQAKAYTFECDGRGTAAVFGVSKTGVETRISTVSMSSNGGFVRYSGFLSGSYPKVKIIFSGSYSYHVRNVAFYNYVTSPNIQDIPAFSETAEYDLKKIISAQLGYLGYGGLASVKCDAAKEGVDYFIEGDLLKVSSEKDLLFKIRYYEFPPEIDADFTGELPVDDKICELLPLYVAGYAWLDDYPEKASYYLKQFEQEAAERTLLKAGRDTIRIKRNGWS